MAGPYRAGEHRARTCGGRFGDYPPASSGLANTRFPCDPNLTHSPPQEGQLIVYRSGTSPLTSKEVYIKRAILVAVPHHVYVDRPVYIDRPINIEKYCHIPFPIHIPVPYFIPTADPHQCITNTENNHLHLHATIAATAQEDAPNLRITGPLLAEILETQGDPDPQPVILLPSPPTSMDQDRGPTERSAAAALCEAEDDDASQAVTRVRSLSLQPAVCGIGSRHSSEGYVPVAEPAFLGATPQSHRSCIILF